MATQTLLDVHDVRRSFPRPGGGELLVLEGVNLTLREGEIVGLLGRSGSGKSTLLRLIAGLANPQGGELKYMGQPIQGCASGIAMVFQSFALFPWLTVLENVQLGLEAIARLHDTWWSGSRAPHRVGPQRHCCSPSRIRIGRRRLQPLLCPL